MCLPWAINTPPVKIRFLPQDVIKSRVQGDGFGEAAKYRGSWHCLKTAFARLVDCRIRGYLYIFPIWNPRIFDQTTTQHRLTCVNCSLMLYREGLPWLYRGFGSTVYRWCFFFIKEELPITLGCFSERK